METHDDGIMPDDWLGRIEYWIAATTLGVAAALVFTSVVLRYGFAYSISAFDELTRYFIILGAFVAASRLLHQERHVTVDVLLLTLPPKWKLMLQIVAFMAGAAFCAFLLYAGLQMVLQSYSTGTRSMSNLRIPMWIPQSFVPLGAALLLIRFLQKAASRLRSILLGQS